MHIPREKHVSGFDTHMQIWEELPSSVTQQRQLSNGLMSRRTQGMFLYTYCLLPYAFVYAFSFSSVAAVGSPCLTPTLASSTAGSKGRPSCLASHDLAVWRSSSPSIRTNDAGGLCAMIISRSPSPRYPCKTPNIKLWGSAWT